MGVRNLLACGLIGPLLFVSVFTVEGMTRPGYSPWRHAVSQLSLGEGGWINIAVLIVTGLLMLGFASGLKRVFRSGVGAVWGPRLMFCVGISLILLGFFVEDPSLGYPPGVPASYSMHGLVHGIAGLLLFASLTALCFVVGRRFGRGDSGWKGWKAYSVVTGWVVALFFIACTVVFTLDEAGVLSPAPSGLLQRISIISGFGWIAVLALRLIREGRQAS